MGGMGLQKNEEEGIKYWEKAAESGDLNTRYNLGCAAKDKNRDFVAAVRHWRLSASGGYKLSMEILIKWFEYRLLRHADLAETLRVFYHARSEMKSEDRDEYIKYLKRTGKYEADCDV
jgi:TPR repeat protein